MAVEQERKYLVNVEQFKKCIENGFPDDEKLLELKFIKQAYLGDSGLWSAFIDTKNPKSPLLLTNDSCDFKMNFSFKDNEKDMRQMLSHPKTALQEDGLYRVDLNSWALRIRLFDSGDGEICLKEKIAGDIRGECECPVNPDIAQFMYESVKKRIMKMRYIVRKSQFNPKKSQFIWEVDLFEDENLGLGTAELETAEKDYPLLSFAPVEVTEDARYYNDNLADTPYTQW